MVPHNWVEDLAAIQNLTNLWSEHKPYSLILVGNLLIVTLATIWETSEIINEIYFQSEAHLKKICTPLSHMFPYYTRSALPEACTLSF